MIFTRIHYNYRPPRGAHDLALVETTNKVNFITDVISPICLPNTGLTDVPEDDDTYLKAYVAGWGMNKDIKCTTNEFGPSPHHVCSSFTHKTKLVSSCIKTEPPSSYHRVCKSFFKWAEDNDKDLWEEKFRTSYLIKYLKKGTNDTKKVTCYSPNAGKYGWCGTCYDFKGVTLRPNQEGYCADSTSGNLRKSTTF